MELKIIEQRTVLDKEFKIYGSFEEPLFLAKDVAKWIEHTNTTEMLKSIDDTEKSVILLPTKHSLVGLQGNTEHTFLTEDGLYEVLMLSRKPIAKQFKKEVKDILKSIRKNGMYAVDELLDNPDLAIKIFMKLKEEREKNKLLQEKIEQDKPKVIFAEALEVSKTSVLVGELAKTIKQNGVEIGANRLFEWLRNNGYLGTKGENYNLPTQKSMDLKIMEIKKTTGINPDGSVRTNRTPKITGKGQQYFINKFLKNKEVC
ncbi:phage antirepressor [Streptobacillus moniliformis]|uniref:phage antirepressor n=1 Tax=Streptobacillus moniliformis TaxID=34105 RepID=UPI0009BF5DB0|nr:phage antirepressor KilAC domain-containing protein [Streptobacillus moniliformis]